MLQVLWQDPAIPAKKKAKKSGLSWGKEMRWSRKFNDFQIRVSDCLCFAVAPWSLKQLTVSECKSGRVGFGRRSVLGLTAEQIPAADQPVEEQNPVQMIHFMLDGSRFITLHLKLARFAELILCPECYEFGAGHVPGILGDRQASFASDRRPFTRNDFGVDQDQSAVVFDFGFAGDINDDDAFKPVRPAVRRCRRPPVRPAWFLPGPEQSFAGTSSNCATGFEICFNRGSG